RVTGVGADQVTAAEALGAFAIVRLATALPITPGGIGIVEVGMSAALVVTGGEETAVVAAVLVYRVLTYLLQVALGVVSYFFWRRACRREADASGAGQGAQGDTQA
ncbi:MAG TPA: YbhN family protein, partial [Gemmatimonadales bacterium]|nr:YbhN family protein [Gemmatimonadales bacterium]